jgi:hypothetical protein
MPTLPVWPVGAQVERMSVLQVLDAIERHSPGAKLDYSDDTFTTVPHEWAVALVKWSREAVNVLSFRTQRDSLYVPETFDCDKFAKAFSLAAELSAGRSISGAQPLVGRIYVRQDHPFGGVAAGGAHALSFFASDRGVFIVEPQGGTVCPLSEYPNRIVRVLIGG